MVDKNINTRPELLLTPDEIKLIQESFKEVDMEKVAAGNILYKHLFELAPHTEKLFTHNIKKQKEMFLIALNICVASIEHPEHISKYLRGLAMRHKKYDVEPELYKYMEEALIFTLRDILEDKMTPQTEKAWRKAYWQIAKQMIQIPGGLAKKWNIDWMFK